MLQIFIYIAILIVSYLLTPKPKTPPSQVDYPDIPIAKQGDPIPVLYGTRWLSQPNVVDFGDLETIEIRSKGGKK